MPFIGEVGLNGSSIITIISKVHRLCRGQESRLRTIDGHGDCPRAWRQVDRMERRASETTFSKAANLNVVSEGLHGVGWPHYVAEDNVRVKGWGEVRPAVSLYTG